MRPNRQGSGVGKKLVNFVSDTMKKQQVNRIFLITGGRQAAEFYQKNGFTKAEDGMMLEFEL
nr:GNAT family N-acetyltransferase [Enterococcus sp. HY326]